MGEGTRADESPWSPLPSTPLTATSPGVRSCSNTKTPSCNGPGLISTLCVYFCLQHIEDILKRKSSLCQIDSRSSFLLSPRSKLQARPGQISSENSRWLDTVGWFLKHLNYATTERNCQQPDTTIFVESILPQKKYFEHNACPRLRYDYPVVFARYDFPIVFSQLQRLSTPRSAKKKQNEANNTQLWTVDKEGTRAEVVSPQVPPTSPGERSTDVSSGTVARGQEKPKLMPLRK